MNEQISKGLPHNPEAERAVLGTAILDADAFLGVIPILRSEDFFLSQHRVIYHAMQTLIGTRQPIDSVTLMEVLTENRQTRCCGGSAIRFAARRWPAACHSRGALRKTRASESPAA